MYDFITTHWADIASFIVIIGAIYGVITHSSNRLHSDFLSLKKDIDDLKEDNRRSFIRLDGHAQRIDQMYGIIVQMLSKKD